MAQLMQMALASFDLLEQRDQEAWRILFETDCPERGIITEQLVLFNETVPDRPEVDRLMTPSDAEPREVHALVEVPELPISRTRWERLNEDEENP